MTMLPIILDAARIRIAVFGNCARARRRLRLLAEAGARNIERYDADFDLTRVDFREFSLIYVVGIDPARAREIAASAVGAVRLVNVEDTKVLCDFVNPAVVRRGALTLSVSTGGLAPGLAGVLAEQLAAILNPIWATRLLLMEAKRRAWRALGASHSEIREAYRRELVRRGWSIGNRGDDGAVPQRVG